MKIRRHTTQGGKIMKIFMYICATDLRTKKHFKTNVECDSRSWYFFLNQELPDIFSYYENCDFYVHGILCSRFVCGHYNTKLYFREEIPYAHL